MSRIGKLPVVVPGGVTASVTGQEVKIKGPKGELALTLVDDVSASLAEGKITLAPRDETKRSQSMWGMQRTLVQNMVTGVTQGYTKTLEISGVGFKAAAKGHELLLNLGFSHDVNFQVPKGIEIKTPKPTEIVISGIDKQQVGQVAAEIRGWREPEPYKGKGIKYSTETVFRKEGKKK